MEDKKPLAVLLTDTHLQESNSNKVISIYEEALKLAIELGVPVVHLGDNFESRKSQPLDNLIAFQRILDLFKDSNTLLYSIVGNHDKLNQSIKESYLTPFKGASNFVLIEDFGLVPLGDIDVFLLSYFTEKEYLDNLESILSMIEDSRKALLLTHIDIKGFVMNSSNLSEHGFSNVVFGRFDKVLVGHYHDYSCSKNIEYIGASLQHNFGEAKDKGIRVLYDNLSTEVVFNSSGISSYTTHYISNIDELSKIDVKSSSNSGHRIVFSGKREELLPILSSKDTKIQELLSSVKVDVKYQSEEQHSTQSEIVTSLDSSEILLHFDKWCTTEGIVNEDKLFGDSLISKIKI